MHATILAFLFQIVENGILSFPLSVDQPAGYDNVLFVKEYVGNLLKTAFPHLTEMQLKLTVVGFFNLDQDLAGFKEHLRDFLVQTREFSGQDDSDLYFEERELQLKAAEAEKRAQVSQVPGILNPHEIAEEEMQD
jgi:exportin-1